MIHICSMALFFLLSCQIGRLRVYVSRFSLVDPGQLLYLVARVSCRFLFQDVGFPYMAMESHLEDTLFIFFE